MSNIETIFKDNSAWSATGNEKFFRTFERIAGDRVRVAFLPSGSGASTAEDVIWRTRSAGITSPVVLFARPIRGRFAPYITPGAEYARGLAGKIQADFPDLATVEVGQGPEREVWAIRIVGKQIEVRAT